MSSSVVQRLIGVSDSGFDRFLRRHRRRLLDRASVLFIGVGCAFVIVAIAGGSVGELKVADLIGAGSVLVATGGLVLSLGSEP